MNTDASHSSILGPARASSDDFHGWRQERKDLIQAVAAGSIVGMPLLYTMEMWWRGMTVSEWHLLVLLGIALLVNFAFSLFSGFRETFSIWEAASESITAVAIGLVYSFLILALIRAIWFGLSWTDAMGKVLVEAIPVSLGISFANQQVRGKARSAEDEKDQDSAQQQMPALSPSRLQLREDLRDLGATLGGAIVFAFNIAPTEEVIKVASRVPAWQHLLIMAASLLLCYTILFASGFEKHRVYVPSAIQSPWAETVIAYAVSLLVALLLLYMIGVPQTMSQLSITAKSVVTLGLPAVVGASAGRLIL